MNRTLLASGSVFMLVSGWAQDCSSGRYRTFNLFPNVAVTSGVVFGSNNGVSGGTQTLRMDIYEPAGDTELLRPAVICAFGGSFITGSRADVAPICNALAKMGYVAVANDYRVGFFIPNEATTTRAVMRGMHDMKAAVRYLRKTIAENGNPYRIDPDRIIVGGVSAGAISAIHATYLDQESEVPAIMVSELPSLGGVEGNSGNPGYSSEVYACYSFSGCIGDTVWIEPADVPLVSLHETGDNVVPYNTQQVSVVGIPTGLTASGSHDIHLRCDHMGMVNCFKSYTANAHVGYLNNDFNAAVGYVAKFLSELVCNENVTCSELVTGLPENIIDAASVHPNPTNGPVRIEVPVAARAVLLDLSGREVMNAWLPMGSSVLDLSALPDGVYVLRADGGVFAPVRVVKAQ